MKLLGISGSLRRASFNAARLHAAQELLPMQATLTIHELHDLPLFDQDVEDEGDPALVNALKHAIDAADALLCRAGAIVAPARYAGRALPAARMHVKWALPPPRRRLHLQPSNSVDMHEHD